MNKNCTDYSKLMDFYKNKRVLITGHTGFKGTWLTSILLKAGAYICGYSLEPPTVPSLFNISGIQQHPRLTHVIGDVRDLNHLKSVFSEFAPEIILHLAAQPIVRDSYQDPVWTYETNVMGTVNVLECIRKIINDGEKVEVCSFLNVTSDKCYRNQEWIYGYREYEPLDGYDPYSNSKSCSELVTRSFRDSFFGENDCVRVSTARAGNVIGGGDFANDRIVPDAVRAMKSAYENKEDDGEIGVRNPYSIRPYQHVLEPLFAYLLIAAKQYEYKKYSSCYNVGPDECDSVTTGKLMDLFCEKWNIQSDSVKLFPCAKWINWSEQDAPHEAALLKLDCSKIKTDLGWQPKWHIEKAIEETVKFSKIWMSGGNVISEMNREIEEYIEV